MLKDTKVTIIIPRRATKVFQLVKIFRCFFGKIYNSNISYDFHLAVFRCSTSKTSSGFYVHYSTKDKDKEEKKTQARTGGSASKHDLIEGKEQKRGQLLEAQK